MLVSKNTIREALQFTVKFVMFVITFHGLLYVILFTKCHVKTQQNIFIMCVFAACFNVVI